MGVKRMVVDSGKWLQVLVHMDVGSIGIALVGGLKMDEIEQVELRVMDGVDRKAGAPSGMVKVRTKDGSTYNLAVRAHLIHWD